MRLLRYLRARRALLAELETLRQENARLRYDLATAVIASWIRRQPEPPRRRRARADPARQRAAETPTEVRPRAARRREPST